MSWTAASPITARVVTSVRRRVYPRPQTSLCSGCGVVITERKRKPCPFCHSMNRTLTRTAVDTLITADKAG
jgi:hypothetical protein